MKGEININTLFEILPTMSCLSLLLFSLRRKERGERERKKMGGKPYSKNDLQMYRDRDNIYGRQVGQGKKFTLSPRENPISFLKDFLLPGERNERNKRE